MISICQVSFLNCNQILYNSYVFGGVSGGTPWSSQVVFSRFCLELLSDTLELREQQDDVLDTLPTLMS